MVNRSAVRRRDERGVSLAVFVSAVMPALFLVAGLAVDGGAQVAAQRRAEVVAARAVRSGTDASAAERLVGRDGVAPALAAARSVLAGEGVDGEASMQAGVLSVTTHTSTPTTFLSLLGITRLDATGAASAALRAS